MKTISIRLWTPKGKKQIAFSLAYTRRQALIDFLKSLTGKAETIVKDAIVSAYNLHGNRHETEALAYAELLREENKTEFIYQAVLAYLPTVARQLVAEARRIKKFRREAKKLA